MNSQCRQLANFSAVVSPTLLFLLVLAMAQPKIRSSCDSCLSSKVKCDQTKPGCARCEQHGQQCVYSHYRKIGRPCLKAAGKQGGSKQADSRVNSKSGQDSRQSAHKTRKQHHRSHNDQCQQQFSVPRPPPTMYDPSSLCLPARTTSPFFPMCNMNDVHIDPTHPLSPHLQATNMQSDRSESSLISPVSWEASLQVGSASSEIEPVAISDVDCVAGFASSEWETLNGMYGFPDVTLQDVPTPFDLDESSATAAAMNDLMSFPRSPPHSIDSACVTPPEVSFASYTSPVADFAFFDTPLYIGGQQPLRVNTQEFSVQEPSPIDSLASSPTLCKPSSMACLLPHQDSARWMWTSTQPRDLVCVEKCHLRLNASITLMASFLANEVSLPSYLLLSLEDHVRSEREKVLRCEACMDRTQRSHTLMLITMIAEKMMKLFEREQPLELRDIGPSALPIGSGNAVRPSKSTIPHRLSILNYRRQIDTFARLESLLPDGGGDADVSARITRGVLADLRKRCGFLLEMQDFVARAGL